MGKTPKAKKKAAAAKKKEMEEQAKQEAAAEQDEYEFQKVCLEIRVKELENLNLGLQRKSEYLASQNEVFKAQLEDLKEEKEDLVAHLERCYREEKTNVKELEDRLYGTYQAMQVERSKYEQKLTQQDKDFDKIKEKMGKNIMELEGKLTALEDFRIQKENLTNEKDRLIKTLEEERERFSRNYTELEDNLIRNRERIKNESVQMIKKMAADVQEAGKLCLTATVKSAITENIRLQNELETTSKGNLTFREKLKNLETQFREKRMTVEILEEENTVLHKKCFQYRLMTQELLDRQMLLEKQLDRATELEDELIILKARHAFCKTDEEIQTRIERALEKVIVDASANVPTIKQGTDSDEECEDEEIIIDPKDAEISKLQDIIIKTAIAAKELSQAENPEAVEFLKAKFKIMLINIFEFACDIPNLPSEINALLQFPAPQVSAYMSYE